MYIYMYLLSETHIQALRSPGWIILQSDIPTCKRCQWIPPRSGAVTAKRRLFVPRKVDCEKTCALKNKLRWPADGFWTPASLALSFQLQVHDGIGSNTKFECPQRRRPRQRNRLFQWPVQIPNMEKLCLRRPFDEATPPFPTMSY